MFEWSYYTCLEARFFLRALEQAEPAGTKYMAFSEDPDSGDSKPGLLL